MTNYSKIPRNMRRRNPARKTRRRRVARRNFGIQTQVTFADKQMVKLNYVETISLDPGAGLAADYVFSANGMYDPNISGIGHQPLGFDQWMTFYDHYTVVGSKISVTLHSSGDTNIASNSGYIGLLLMDSSTSQTGTSHDYLIEQGKTSYKPYGESSSSGGIVKLFRKMGTKKFFGRKNVMDNSDLRGSASANPAEQNYWHLWVSPINLSYDPVAVYITVKITYTAILTEPKVLAQS